MKLKCITFNEILKQSTVRIIITAWKTNPRHWKHFALQNIVMFLIQKYILSNAFNKSLWKWIIQNHLVLYILNGFEHKLGMGSIIFYTFVKKSRYCNHIHLNKNLLPTKNLKKILSSGALPPNIIQQYNALSFLQSFFFFLTLTHKLVPLKYIFSTHTHLRVLFNCTDILSH